VITGTPTSGGKIVWPSWIARDVTVFAILAAFGLASPGSRSFEQNANNTKASPSTPQTAASSDEQAQSTKDRELARRLRRAVVSDKSLSTYAHNIRIVAQNGVLTLEGSVRSADEKNAIAAKATEIAGPKKVKDEMSVKPKG
jgi:osmotically-inducible protein OsmY